MTDTIRGASSNPTSQLAPPTLQWGIVGPSGDACDLCSAPIKPHGDCYLSIRRAFELAPDHRRMIETAPLSVLMCIDCGIQRPYAPVPREGAPMVPEAPKTPQEPASEQGEASYDVEPDYYSSDIMDDGDRG